RAAATALGKATWFLAAAFIVTSLTLTVIAAEKSAGSSVLDRIGNQPSRNSDAPAAPALPSGDSLLPPTAGDDAPLVPKAD
ncbi:MAG: preprotein translocase subunit SecG, partial [Rhodobacteraceae bacterium]|nr:preprotein translocase subunit SecG [Paracoccaceae bacterium]